MGGFTFCHDAPPPAFVAMMMIVACPETVTVSPPGDGDTICATAPVTAARKAAILPTIFKVLSLPSSV